ncbi:hypothetical protein COL940_007480 [Colletotrichum noveboracense]|nr:hypothetical protein COL940_007480 [Colletotrichum noveboracense]
MGAAMMEQFAARGDRVIATGRSATVRLADKKSSNIFPLDLDATAPLAVVREQIEKAIQVFGYIDFVVNNAGISVPQTIEEADDAFTQKMLDTNLIGAIRLVQAVLPHFRERKAVFAENLQRETAHLGLRAVVFEPGAFVTRTRTAADEGLGGAPSISDYQSLFGEIMGKFSSPEMAESIPSTVEELPSAVWDVVKSEGMASGKPFPIRVPLGLDALAVIRQKCYEQLRLCDEWEKVALSTTKDGADTTPNKYLLEKMSIMNLTK